MKSLFETYDRHLKGLASMPAAQRMRAMYRAMFPWALVAMAGFLTERLLGLPRSIGAWIILSTTCVAVVGTLYAGWRVAKHGWLFDRTPTDRDLMEMCGSDELVDALRRITLNGLSNLNLTTRLRADLKLTEGDISQLLGILEAEKRLDAPALEAIKSGDTTIESLLQKMSRV